MSGLAATGVLLDSLSDVLCSKECGSEGEGEVVTSAFAVDVNHLSSEIEPGNESGLKCAAVDFGSIDTAPGYHGFVFCFCCVCSDTPGEKGVFDFSHFLLRDRSVVSAPERRKKISEKRMRESCELRERIDHIGFSVFFLDLLYIE